MAASNLTLRVISAVVLIPIVVGAVFWLPPIILFALVGLFIAAGAWEWAPFAGWVETKQRIMLVALILLLGAGCYFAPNFDAMPWMWAAALWWLIAFLLIVATERETPLPWLKQKSVVISICIFTLIPPWLAIGQIHAAPTLGPVAVIYLFVLVWVADIAAYFAGRAFGRHRLAPTVSPKKSWEGAVGGLVGAATVAAIAHQLAFAQAWALAEFVLIGVGLAAISILGDLTESLHKRASDIKDSGSLIPGHGGVLDRIDSLTATAPFFWLIFL